MLPELNDKQVFLFGGGPSLKAEKYDNIISKLPDNSWSIGVNMACCRWPGLNANLGLDIDLYKKLKADKRYIRYSGYKIWRRPRRNSRIKDKAAIWLSFQFKRPVISFGLSSRLYGGTNSGMAALLLSVALGAKKIYLLGIDCNIDELQTHWHDEYDKQSINTFKLELQKYIDEFNLFSKALKKEGVDVINLNPDSGVKCFERKRLEDVINYNN